MSNLHTPQHTRLEIRQDDLRSPEIAALLREHLEFAALHTPARSIHALDLDALRAPGITFFSAWDGPALAGCGALREIDRRHGEIKSMRTATTHLRKGVAAAILTHILAVARQRRYGRVSLETGSSDAFAPARALYAKFGFSPCNRFAEYPEDPFSFFMTIELEREGGMED